MAVDVEYVIRLNDKLSAKLEGVQKQVNRLNNTVTKTKSSFSNIGKVAARAFAAIGAGAAIQNITETTATVESLNNAIEFASGSAEEFAKNQQFLSKLSKDLGLDLMTTTEGFKTLTGSMLGLGFEGEEQRKIFSQVSTAVSAMGLSADQSQGALLALGQIMSKGKVQAEELRGQLGERLPGAFNIAARSLGVTTAELNKMLEQGLVSANDFLPKFAAELDKTFRGGLAKSTKSARANLNRFNNTLLELKLILGEVVVPIVLQLMNAFREGLQFIKNNAETFKTLGKIALVAAAAYAAFNIVLSIQNGLIALSVWWNGTSTAAIILNTLATEGMTAAMLALNMALSANPIGLIVAAIAALVAIIVVVIRHYNSWGAAVTLLMGPLGMLINIVQAFRRNWEDVKKAFSEGGFLEGLKKIGAVMLDSLLMPIQQLLELVSRIPGLSGIAGKGAEKILALRERLGVRTAGEESATTAEDSLTSKAGTGGAVSGGAVVGGGAGSGGALGAKVSEVKANAPKVFNINIEKLVEALNVNTTNLRDTSTRIKDEVEKALLTAITDASIISE